jgi:hypothetical protein
LLIEGNEWRRESCLKEVHLMSGMLLWMSQEGAQRQSIGLVGIVGAVVLISVTEAPTLETLHAKFLLC